MNDIPSSRKIWEGSAKNYWITAAEWNSTYGSSYEVGVREKEGGGEFWLIQGDWPEQNIQKVAEAVLILLDAGYTPTEISEIL